MFLLFVLEFSVRIVFRSTYTWQNGFSSDALQLKSILLLKQWRIYFLFLINDWQLFGRENFFCFERSMNLHQPTNEIFRHARVFLSHYSMKTWKNTLVVNQKIIELWHWISGDNFLLGCFVIDRSAECHWLWTLLFDKRTIP